MTWCTSRARGCRSSGMRRTAFTCRWGCWRGGVRVCLAPAPPAPGFHRPFSAPLAPRPPPHPNPLPPCAPHIDTGPEGRALRPGPRHDGGRPHRHEAQARPRSREQRHDRPAPPRAQPSLANAAHPAKGLGSSDQPPPSLTVLASKGPHAAPLPLIVPGAWAATSSTWSPAAATPS